MNFKRRSSETTTVVNMSFRMGIGGRRVSKTPTTKNPSPMEANFKEPSTSESSASNLELSSERSPSFATMRIAEDPRSPNELPTASRSQVSPTLDAIDQLFVQVFALVGEGIAGATHALLAGDREAAKELVQRDEMVDKLIHEISHLAQHYLITGDTTQEERRELAVVLRMLPDLERNGDLAEHIARRAARGLGAEMSARSRGLVERMGEVAASIWRNTADVFAERSVVGASNVDDLDDELDDLHVTLTAELVAGTMPLPVAIELAMVARFYERFGDHAVNLARRMASLVGGGLEPGTSGPD